MKLQEIEYGLSGIYKIIFDNDKVYIGLSNDIRRRMLEHYGRDLKQHPELLISKAIIKHQTKDIEIIEFIDGNNRQKLIEREKYWIAYYNSFLDRSKGYNMTPGGDGNQSGIYNNASYITEENLNIIYTLLLNSNLTYTEIADQTGTSYSIVSHINNGVHYRNDSFNYPLRKLRCERYELNNKHSSFYNREQDLQNLINDLKENILPTQKLLDKYNIKTTTLSLINQGKKYRQNNEVYPLRPVDKGKSQRRIFSQTELNIIKDYLSNSKKNMAEIGQELQCDRSLISEVNSGKRQKQLDWIYPLRKIPLKTGPKSSKPVSTILETEEQGCY